MNAIEITDLHKKFKIYHDKASSLKEKILFKNRNRYEDKWVLKGINLEIKKGETVGLIGENGSGKSTLLKLLAKIIYPNKGAVTINGRVSSMLELGAGFHPDLSGLENIYTNASIFGLTKKEIDRRIDAIVEFSGLYNVIDNPVRVYSSGMYAKLAFAVAVNVDAEILLIDEILSVGDANFQAKCFNKMREIKANGTTIVIVSHSLGQIEQLCERSIWLNDGIVCADGAPREVHLEYLDFMVGIRNTEEVCLAKRKKEDYDLDDISVEVITDAKGNEMQLLGKNHWGTGNVRFKKISIADINDKEKKLFKTGEDIIISCEYEVIKPIKEAVFGFGVFRADNLHFYGSNTKIDKMPKYELNKDGILKIKIESINLLPGEYKFDLAISDGEELIHADYYKNAIYFLIYSDIEDVGLTRLSHTWSIK